MMTSSQSDTQLLQDTLFIEMLIEPPVQSLEEPPTKKQKTEPPPMSSDQPPTMSSDLFYKLDLSLDRQLRVVKWRGEYRVDIRVWKNTYPTKSGVSLTIKNWKVLTDNAESISRSLKNPNHGDFAQALDGPFAIFVRKESNAIHIRRRNQPEDSPDYFPADGVTLHIDDWETICKAVPFIDFHLPGIHQVTPCYKSHMYTKEDCPNCHWYRYVPGFEPVMEI
jgi:hypothetical protein